MIIRISTWNVNSIRARITSLIEWLKNTQPDIVMLQELKCTDEQFPILELSELNYNIVFKGQKSYNGVAILSKFKLYDTVYDLPTYDIVDIDNESRYIEAKIDINGKSVKIASIYVPNGGPPMGYEGDITETEKFYSKIKFYKRLNILFKENLKKEELVFYCGDFNVCPILEKDVYSVQKDGAITCNIKERNEFQEFLNSGMHDTFREINPNLMEFSWWGYRPINMFEKNQGYRLDAILATKASLQIVEDCFIEKNLRSTPKPSDHVPMTCIINI